MLGIWEYFWDVLDWTAPVVSPTNIRRVTATMAQLKIKTTTTAQLVNKMGKV